MGAEMQKAKCWPRSGSAGFQAVVLMLLGLVTSAMAARTCLQTSAC